MTIQLTRTYEVLSEHTFTVTLTQEEYDEYLIDEPDPEDVDYSDMYEYFEAKGHNVDHEEHNLDYQSQGVTVEFL